MYKNCINLSSVPENLFPNLDKNLGEYSINPSTFEEMFANCTSLNEVSSDFLGIKSFLKYM
jgi:hypothetical protein